MIESLFERVRYMFKSRYPIPSLLSECDTLMATVLDYLEDGDILGLRLVSRALDRSVRRNTKLEARLKADRMNMSARLGECLVRRIRLGEAVTSFSREGSLVWATTDGAFSIYDRSSLARRYSEKRTTNSTSNMVMPFKDLLLVSTLHLGQEEEGVLRVEWKVLARRDFSLLGSIEVPRPWIPLDTNDTRDVLFAAADDHMEMVSLSQSLASRLRPNKEAFLTWTPRLAPANRKRAPSGNPDVDFVICDYMSALGGPEDLPIQEYLAAPIVCCFDSHIAVGYFKENSLLLKTADISNIDRNNVADLRKRTKTFRTRLSEDMDCYIRFPFLIVTTHNSLTITKLEEDVDSTEVRVLRADHATDNYDMTKDRMVFHHNNALYMYAFSKEDIDSLFQEEEAETDLSNFLVCTHALPPKTCQTRVNESDNDLANDCCVFDSESGQSIPNPDKFSLTLDMSERGIVYGFSVEENLGCGPKCTEICNDIYLIDFQKK